MTTTPVNGSGNLAHKTVDLVDLSTLPRGEKKLTIVPFGLFGSGKTRFAATAPGPIGVIPLNSKCRATIENIWRKDFPSKKFIFPKQDLIRHAKAMQIATLKPKCVEDSNAFGKIQLNAGVEPVCCAMHYYRWHVDRVKDSIWTMAASPLIETIVIDDCTVLYEDILFANFGRTNQLSTQRTVYAGPNREMAEIINSAKDKKHLILLSQAKPEYVNDKRTDKYKIDGCSKLGFDTTVILYMYRDQKTNDFYADVQLCQENASLNGDAGLRLLANDEINFATLAAKIFADDDNFLEVYMEYQEKCQ